MARPTLFSKVLSDELRAIDWRRARARMTQQELLDGGLISNDLEPDHAPAEPNETTRERRAREDGNAARFDAAMRRAALDRDLVGLAFSGGGIRSATFALGVLQGLGRIRMLKRIDYLSTVSGGGYIGSWLAAWIRRESTCPDPPTPESSVPMDDPVGNVQLQLNPSRLAQAGSERPVSRVRRVVEEEPEAIRHLRSFSNYLTPRPGLLTTDFWTLLSIYVRNFLLNQLILLPGTVAFVVLAWLVVALFGPRMWEAGSGWLALILAFLLLVPFGVLGLELSKLYRARTKFSRAPSARAQRAASWRLVQWLVQPIGGTTFQLAVILPLFLASILVVWLFGYYPDGRYHFQWFNTLKESNVKLLSWIARGMADDKGFSHEPAVALAVVFGLLHLLPHAFGCVGGLALDFARISGTQEWEDRLKRDGLVLAASLASGLFGGFLLYLFVIGFLYPCRACPGMLATFGPPLAVVLFTAAVFFEVGLLGRVLEEDEREWWATVTSHLLTKSVVWLGVFAVIVYVPWLVLKFNAWVHSSALTPALVMGWVATSLGGVFGGRHAATAKSEPGPALNLFLKAVPFVFLVGLLAGVSGLVWSVAAQQLPDGQHPFWFTDLIENHQGGEILRKLSLAFLYCLVAAFVTNLLINVNLFSLHSMYANRLTRCYLGASRRKENWRTTWRNGVWHPGQGGAPTGSGGKVRSGQSLTGFDFQDDMALRDLQIGPGRDDDGNLLANDAGYWGPFRLINTAISLEAGEELALQDRKSASFVLSPLYCGSKETGYRKLKRDADKILTLGRAMAISGAAVDPSFGIKQSAALAALLTIFNARLGWWVENPKNKETWSARSPRFAGLLWYELFGLIDENGPYVHLADGGHFENLGVYELVRRRCRYIIACDAGQDQKSIYDDLATLTRLCRSDFGVRIDIDTSPLEPPTDGARGRWHCAVGQIHYEDVDVGEAPGLLIYIKASLTGDEPSDVKNYAATHPEFPHQTTADQFFDEAQFESYRALGHHVASTVFNSVASEGDVRPHKTNQEEVVRRACKEENRKLFSRLRARWFPAPAGIESNYDEIARAFGVLQGVMRSDGTLRPYSRDMYPELGRAPADDAGGSEPDAPAPAGKQARANRRSAELHMANQVLQVVEKAWRGIRLEGYPEHPISRGWMNALRRVARSKTLQRVWPIVRGGYDQEFVQFLERELGLLDGSPTVFPLAWDESGQHYFIPGVKTVDGAVRLLAGEFSREWPKEDSLESLIGQAQNLKLSDRSPASWLISSTRFDAKTKQFLPTFPIGVVLARTFAPGDLALLAWLRGPHRSMGIGRDCLAAETNGRSLLAGITDDLAKRKDPAAKRLVARFPATKPGSRAIERKLWLNFHYAHEFRAAGLVDVESGAELLMYRALD